ncbi:MAG: MFS transporter [Bryobacteraceae bacterium]
MPVKRARLVALAVLFAINVLNFYDRNVAGALAEPMRRDFGLNDTQIGLLGSAFIWIYAIVGVPFGRVADRYSRKKLLAIGMLIWGGLTAFAGIASTYAMLMVSRIGVGVGEAVVAPAGTSWIGDLVPASRRARALSIFMLGVPIGGALSYFFSGPIAQAFGPHGWRIGMMAAAAPALLLIPLLLILREPVRGAAETVQSAAPTGSFWTVLRIPTLWWIIASGALINFNMYAIGTFLPAFLSRIHGLSLARSGVTVGVAYAVGGIAGGGLAGVWGDRIIHARKDGRMLSAALIAALGAPLGYFGIVQGRGSVVLAVVLITLAYGTLNSYYGLVYSSIQDIVAPAFRGTAMSIYFMFMYLGGASFGPLLTGNLSDRLARRAAGAGKMTEAFKAIGLQQAMVVIPILSLALGVILYLGSRTIARDMGRREAEQQALGVAAVGEAAV